MLRFLPAACAATLLVFASPVHAADVCGDVNQTRTVSSADALLVLKVAMGQPVPFVCPSIARLAICSGNLVATRRGWPRPAWKAQSEAPGTPTTTRWPRV